MKHILLNHAKLGLIKCVRDSPTAMIKILGLPYGTISQRFARSKLASNAYDYDGSRHQNGAFDATRPGPSSIQPWGSVKSDAANIPLPTEDIPADEEQSENCLNLSIRLPLMCLDDKQELRSNAKVPVLVFIHGGAYFLGSANRPYYDPTNLVRHAIERDTPIIMVGINYRLGILGFLHSDRAGDMMPENNGLHDQDLAFEWLREHIEEFGGDIDNITVIGQSAGGESISVQTMRKPLFRRAIMFSGTPVTMPALTHDEHHDNFITQARQLGIEVTDHAGKERGAIEVAKKMVQIDVAQIRNLAWVGLPCTSSSFFPVEKVSMQLIKTGKLAPPGWREWAKPVEAQIVGSCTYDGGISYNMMSKDKSRKDHAKAFMHISQDVLGEENGRRLSKLYDVHESTPDSEALQRICLFESDIGFFAAALSVAENGLVPDTYFHIFDLPNPFPGPIREHGAFATHTFDIVTLFGGVHEDQLPANYGPVISRWREQILDFVVRGAPPCNRYLGGKDTDRCALLVDESGSREVESRDYLDDDGHRRSRLFKLAQDVAGDAGWDVLWVGVCRRFLMRGK